MDKTTVLPDLIGFSPEKVYTESLCSVLDVLPTKSINSVLYDLVKRAEDLYGVDYSKLLMDAIAVYFEGDTCTLLSFGYNPVYKNKKQIIVFLAITEKDLFFLHSPILAIFRKTELGTLITTFSQRFPLKCHQRF